MGTQAFFVELLLSGFFAVACLKARAHTTPDKALSPRDLFALASRLERLRRSRWQWFSMVLLIVLVRLQHNGPIVAEMTGLAMFVVFIAIPTAKSSLVGRSLRI